MSIHVTDFAYEKGKNDAEYIELLEKALKNEQRISSLAVEKVRKLSKENQEIRASVIDEFAEKSKDGLLAELPCKPGDHVWVLFHNYYAECEVTKLTLTKYPNIGLNLWVIDEERPIQSSSSDFGFTLFHTEEEAKCVLEKEEEEKLR